MRRSGSSEFAPPTARRSGPPSPRTEAYEARLLAAGLAPPAPPLERDGMSSCRPTDETEVEPRSSELGGDGGARGASDERGARERRARRSNASAEWETGWMRSTFGRETGFGMLGKWLAVDAGHSRRERVLRKNGGRITAGMLRPLALAATPSPSTPSSPRPAPAPVPALSSTSPTPPPPGMLRQTSLFVWRSATQLERSSSQLARDLLIVCVAGTLLGFLFEGELEKVTLTPTPDPHPHPSPSPLTPRPHANRRSHRHLHRHVQPHLSPHRRAAPLTLSSAPRLRSRPFRPSKSRCYRLDTHPPILELGPTRTPTLAPSRSRARWRCAGRRRAKRSCGRAALGSSAPPSTASLPPTPPSPASRSSNSPLFASATRRPSHSPCSPSPSSPYRSRSTRAPMIS